MSGGRFLGNAVAAREGSYFLKQSKNAVGSLISSKRLSPSSPQTPSPTADVLPEILRHSLPLSPSPPSPPTPSSLSKWTIPSSSPSLPRPSANPISSYISLPQVTFGPRRWELPQPGQSVTVSTANDLRADRYDAYATPERIRVAAAGLAQVGKAFLIATVLVFGGATMALVGLTSKLHIETSDDIKLKAQGVIQPKVEKFKDHIVPFQAWAGRMSRKWHMEGEEGIKQRPIIKELSKQLGGKSPN